MSGGIHQLVGIQDQGHGAVVHRRHLHVRTEAAMLGRIPQFLADAKELFIKFVPQLRPGGFHKAGAAALAAVALEGELAHHQHLAPHLFQA